MRQLFANICIWIGVITLFVGIYLTFGTPSDNINDDMNNAIAAMNQKYYNDPAFALFLADAIKDGVIVKEEYYRLKNRARICDIIYVRKDGVYASAGFN